MDTSAAPYWPRGGTADRVARKRKSFRYEEIASLRRLFKQWGALNTGRRAAQQAAALPVEAMPRSPRFAHSNLYLPLHNVSFSVCFTP